MGSPIRVKGSLWLHSSSVQLQEGGRAGRQGGGFWGGSQRPSLEEELPFRWDGEGKGKGDWIFILVKV